MHAQVGPRPRRRVTLNVTGTHTTLGTRFRDLEPGRPDGLHVAIRSPPASNADDHGGHAETAWTRHALSLFINYGVAKRHTA